MPTKQQALILVFLNSKGCIVCMKEIKCLYTTRLLIVYVELADVVYLYNLSSRFKLIQGL